MKTKVESAFYQTIMEGVAKYVKKHTPTYSTAKVVEIKNNTPYVMFPGAETPTPVTTVTNAAKGDDVLVQVNSNGDAYVYGNLTDQPVSKVEVDKITENTTNILQQFEYSLDEIIKELTGKFVEIGDSDIQILSSNIIKNNKGLNLFNSLGERGDNYIHTDETGFDIKTITVNGELNDTVTSTKNLIGGVYPHMHFGKDYILYGQTWQTGEASIGERAVGFGNVRPNSKYAFAAGNQAVVQGSNYGVAFNSGTVQDAQYGFAANAALARAGYSAALNKAYADGESSFASGSSGNFAKGMYSAVFGNQTVASGKSSIAEGYGENSSSANTAKGIASHVAGYRTKTDTNGNYSFVSGMFNTSNYVGQTIVGRANVNKADTIFEVGNGKVRYNQTYAGYPLYDKLSNSNGFEVTEDGYIRTGVGMEKIGFGKESNVYGYFIPPDLTLPQVLGYYYNTKFYEEPEHLTEITGESGKLYKDQTDGATILLYRWENNEFIDADTPVFIAWGSGGGGGSYTAGDGIDISPTNEISVTDDIARTADIPTVPTNVSAFFNDAGYLTQHQDLSNYIQKSLTAGLVKNDGTIDTTDYAEASDIPDVSNFISKSQTSGLVKNDGTIDTTDYAEASDIPDVSNFISKSQTSGLVKNDGTIDTTAYATASALTGYLPLAGGTMAGAINSQHIVPATNDSYRLGSSSSKYNSAYIKRIYSLASIESTTDGSKRLIVPAKSGTIAVNEDLPEVVGNLIAVNPILESGTLIANITINGDSKNIYAPPGGSSYAAGNGIDISNNEISVDNTIARVSAIPSVGDGTITIQKNSSTVGSFTTNQSSAKTINISISKSDVGLSNVENKSSSTIRGELTSTNVITALGFTPYNSNNPSGYITGINSSMVISALGYAPVSPSAYMTFKNCPKSSVSFRGTASSGVWYTIFEFSSYTTAILKIISREWSVSTNFIFINSRYTNGDSTPSFTILGGSYNNGGYNEIRICRKTEDLGSRCSLDILYDGNGEPIEVEVLYCSSTDYNLYNQITPALYSYVVTKIDHKPKDSIETSGDIAINYKGSINYGPTPNYANNWSTFLSNAEIGSTSDGLNISIGAMETSGIHMDSDTIVMWSPCDNGALWYYDEDSGDPVFHIDSNGKYYDRSGNSYLPLAGGTMSAGARITFTNSASEDGVYLNNGSYELRLIIGSGGVNRGLWDGSRWMIYENAYDTWLDSGRVVGSNKNFVINSQSGNFSEGLRINSTPNDANGYAAITMGTPNGTATGISSSYSTYQIGKFSDLSGDFAIRSCYAGTLKNIFRGSVAATRIYSWQNESQCIEIKNNEITINSLGSTNSDVIVYSNMVKLFGNTSSGSGGLNTFIINGYGSSYIDPKKTIDTNVYLNAGGELVLLFLASGDGNSFYAARLLRNNNGSLQTINLASNGTSHATVTMSSTHILIENTNSTYKLYYKILKLG